LSYISYGSYVPQLVRRPRRIAEEAVCSCGKKFLRKTTLRVLCDPCAQRRARLVRAEWKKKNIPHKRNIIGPNITKLEYVPKKIERAVTHSTLMDMNPDRLAREINKITKDMTVVLAANRGDA
jgi:hypothetical protein